jgi:hypothetical protein
MFRTCVAVLLTAAAAATPRTAMSPALADSFARKLDSLGRADPKGGKPAPSVEVSEGEVNSYVNYVLGSSLPAGIRDVELQIDRDRLQATGQVEIEEIKRHLGELSPWNPISFLRGSVPIVLSGGYETVRDGFGRVDIDEVRAAGINIPRAVVEQMIASATKSAALPQGVDINAPFRLPQPIRRIRLQPGRAVLDL